MCENQPRETVIIKSSWKWLLEFTSIFVISVDVQAEIRFISAILAQPSFCFRKSWNPFFHFPGIFAPLTRVSPYRNDIESSQQYKQIDGKYVVKKFWITSKKIYERSWPGNWLNNGNNIFLGYMQRRNDYCYYFISGTYLLIFANLEVKIWGNEAIPAYSMCILLYSRPIFKISNSYSSKIS